MSGISDSELARGFELGWVWEELLCASSHLLGEDALLTEVESVATVDSLFSTTPPSSVAV